MATISPLLGLFGTILGMIEAFQRIAVTSAVGNPSIVADGISKALLTTAAGLFVGIPALAFYHYFKNRILQLACIIEENANVALHDWLLANDRER